MAPFASVHSVPAVSQGDRFIPVRGAMDMDMARFNLTSALLESQAPGQQGAAGADEAQDRDGASGDIPVQSPSKVRPPPACGAPDTARLASWPAEGAARPASSPPPP